MQRSQIAYFALTGLCAAWIGLAGYLNPINNWDLVAYTASVHKNSGLSGAALHEATYAELRRSVPPDGYAALSQGSRYSQGVFADPEALEQQLPFYRIRVAYILLLQAVGPVAGGVVRASYLISAVSTAALVLLTGALLHRAMPRIAWPIAGAALIGVLYFSYVPQLARLSTPDALYSFVALAALALFYKARTAGLLLIAVLPLIRTDAIVLSALLGVLLLAERDRDLRHYGTIAASVAAYLWATATYGRYDHLTLFNFSFLPGQRSPYPETLQIVRDSAVYLDVYLQRAAGMAAGWVPWLLLAAVIMALLERRRTGHSGPLARLSLVAVGYVLLHFAAFPLGAARHYGFALIICGVFAISLLALSVFRSKG